MGVVIEVGVSMSDIEIEYFSDRKVIHFCQEASRALRKLPISSYQHDIFLRDTLITILDDISEHPNIYDEQCRCNINWIGNSFVSNIAEIGSSIPSESLIEKTVVMAYRFLSERDFNLGLLFATSIHSAFHSIENQRTDFSQENQRQITYANYVMPAHIVKELIKNDNFLVIQDFSRNVKKFEDLKIQSEKEIQDRETAVETLKSTLEGYKNAFNFVGLSAGFQGLYNRKNYESLFAYAGLVSFGFFMLYFPINAYLNSNVLNSTVEFSVEKYFFSIAPLFTLELICIYFFRVILSAHNSINKQKLQLELRVTLCQFIQSYVDYAKSIKEKDKTALDKFENLIFSGIVSDDQNLPSTFDGIEQISKLIEAVKKSK
jgi:hypothetical protein